MNLSASILSSKELSFSLSKDLLNTALFKSLISSVIRSSCCLIVRASSANDLFKFIVRINDKSVIIRPILQSNRDKEIQKYKYFDNDGLKEVVDYANNKYITVPNDKSLTNFYTLDIDKDYNIIPKIPKI